MAECVGWAQAMIGVTSCLAAEFARGVGLKEQIGEAPVHLPLVCIVLLY